MKIVINCLGMPFSGDTIETSSLGGSETAAYYMAKELVKIGHEVVLFTRGGEGLHDGVKYQDVGETIEAAPMGKRFHMYAENTPHDVCIIQRHPQAFAYKWASKINLWWLHDLAQHRTKAAVDAHMWNVDGVLCVSEFHKKQVSDVWGIESDIIHVVRNAADSELFTNASECEARDATETYLAEMGVPAEVKRLIYISRPERGLEWLVKTGGIMEQLGDGFHLMVCNYDNVAPQMKGYYQFINAMINKLPNVTFIGHLNKQQLAGVLCASEAMVYPTPSTVQPNFEEVSCIAAIEAMHAGIPFISTSAGALPETNSAAGCVLLNTELLEQPQEFIEVMTKMVRTVCDDDKTYEMMAAQQMITAVNFLWSKSAEVLSDVIDLSFSNTQAAIEKHLINHSDIYAYKYWLKNVAEYEDNLITQSKRKEFVDCYSFTDEPDWGDHYANYYEYEKERGVNYGAESLDGNTRFECVAGIVGAGVAGSRWLDYGCAHGHYTINLAKRFPDREFIGIDLTLSNIEKAQQWAKADGVENVSFHHADITTGYDSEFWQGSLESFDGVIACEVVEHVADPITLMERLESQLSECGKFVISVPYGEWEAQGYIEHWPWRAHVHHFEHEDLNEIFANKSGYRLTCAPGGRTPQGDVLGSYIAQWNKVTGEPFGTIDYDRKLSALKTKQTLSLCMIIKGGEETILQCLNSVRGTVDELIVGYDDVKSMDIINQWSERNHVPILGLMLGDELSPVNAGFDTARNYVIDHASGDWILWLDADEKLVNTDCIIKYLRDNQYNGYSIAQHHYSEEPVGVMKTDYPVKLFRNRLGIQFYGKVHEHPELALGEGVGKVYLIDDVEISHYGYSDEAVRRGRFARNYELMNRDREEYPERVLGKALRLRDIAQLVQHELEANHGAVTKEVRQQAKEGVELYKELLNSEDTVLRYAIEFLPYYSLLVELEDDYFEFSFKLDASKLNGGTHLDRQAEIKGSFISKDDLNLLLSRVVDLKTDNFDSKYY